MTITVDLPDDIARRLAADGAQLSRAALEAIALEGYRSGTLSALETRRLLGFETRYELDGFLKQHQVWEHAYDLEDLEQDRRTIAALGNQDHENRR